MAWAIGFALGAQTVLYARSPFATRVVEYRPAPGQFVNDARFNDPTKALGPPVGGGRVAADHSSVVSLGGFGGYLVLAFEEPVTDDPLNPLGLDAIVFGNAFWAGGDPDAHFAECGTIEIALDADRSGAIDGEESWYLIPGSHLPEPSQRFFTQHWDDDPNTPTPPALLSWVPPKQTGQWTTQGYLLPENLFGSLIVRNPVGDTGREGIFGYADYAPTLLLGDMDGDDIVDDAEVQPEDFYTIPDDPLTVGITPGTGGGDAFDIAWAVDAATGQPANLSAFDFIRITSANLAIHGPAGETSTEVDAVADVAPDPHGDADGDGDIDLADAAVLQRCFGYVNDELACPNLDRNGDALIDLDDTSAVLFRLTGPIAGLS